ncbi:hypothetical protein [Kocuria turfanensis]|nr:hypothetical protein [Kocuria turfanensis]
MHGVLLTAVTGAAAFVFDRNPELSRPARWWTLGGSMALLVVTVGVVGVLTVHLSAQVVDACPQGVSDPPVIGSARVETGRSAAHGIGTSRPAEIVRLTGGRSST